ncbi:Imm5 family immunity protein [Paraburkholderia kururiensis]|uniref:Imm5 family immunity protein n=1 Tax=Paraburkholderia kururiensis TaxID=984307 RepID=UPI0039A58024
MAIPSKLATKLVEASSSITNHGELPAVERKNILQLVEDLSLAEHARAGYLRRARLALICAHEVLNRMNGFPDLMERAGHMLALGSSALSGQYELKLLQTKNGEFHTDVIDLFQHGEVAFVAAYAGMATFSAINTVLFDTNFDTVGNDEKAVPPDDWDASYYGSLATSGSAIWEGKGGIASRRAYWTWYLAIAVPEAWDVVTPLDFG